jgi:hypothetical protein
VASTDFDCRLVVPEGYVAQPSTADGGAAPSPHRLALYIYRRPGRESVLQVRWLTSIPLVWLLCLPRWFQ